MIIIIILLIYIAPLYAELLRYGSASLSIVACRRKLRGTWSTVARQFRKSPAVDNYAQSSLYHFTVPPRYRLSTFERRALSVVSHTSWNSLPDRLRDPTVHRVVLTVFEETT